MLVPSPTAQKHTVARNHRGRENNINATTANFSAMRTVWRNPGTWHLPYVYHCAKNSARFPIPTHAGIVGHDIGKCTLFYCCFDHYRMLANKISVCEVCIIWRKPTEAFKNPSPIAESRTGKPSMVALKIQLDCSTVHDKTMWANIFMHSHLGCFHPFLQVSHIFQRRKSDAKKQDFESKFNLTCQAQSTPKIIGILIKVFCTSGSNLLVLAWTGDELLHGQTNNGVNFDFEGKFNLECKGQSILKTIVILTKVFYTCVSNLVILTWTGLELSRL